MSKKFNVAMVGLGFGSEFIPIYQAHPLGMSTHCANGPSRSSKRSATISTFQSDTRSTKTLLKDPKVDYVHINSPIPDHAWMSMEALKAGKHVMCTVPMATTIEDCEQICELVKKTGRKYMMAETVVYSRSSYS